jgi:hypothetical protein
MGYYSAQASLSRRGAQTSLCTRRMACTGCALCTLWGADIYGWQVGVRMTNRRGRNTGSQYPKLGSEGEGVDAFAVKRELPWSKNAQRGIYTLPSLHSSQEIGLYLLQQIHSTYNLSYTYKYTPRFSGRRIYSTTYRTYLGMYNTVFVPFQCSGTVHSSS